MKRESPAFLIMLVAGVVITALNADRTYGQERTASTSEILIIDGSLSDGFWKDVPPRGMHPGEDGVPADMRGEVRIGLHGSYLCFGARLPEAGGKVLSRSVGRNPNWETDHPESPPVEDRVRFQVRHSGSGGEERHTHITVNPWGAYRLEQDGVLVDNLKLPTAATVDPNGWSVETALPLSLFDLTSSPVRVQTVRIRARRPLAPEFQWFWPERNSHANFALSPSVAPAPEFRPPVLGNTEPPLEVGRPPTVPPMPEYLDTSRPYWDDPAWSGIEAFELPRNEPYPRAPRYPTAIKWVHDGETLSLLVRAVEPEPLVANNGGRDSRIDNDDHIAIRLAIGGPHFLEILVNSAGAIRDWKGSDLHSVRRPSLTWNADIAVQTNIRHGAWIAQINVPLDQCAEALGEPSIPSQWRVLLSRYRAPRLGEPAEISALPPLGTGTFYGILRYRRMVLSDRDPSQVARLGRVSMKTSEEGLAQELAALDSRVWPALDRHYRAIRSMVSHHQRRRAEKAVLDERRAWQQIRTRQDWEKFRAERLEKLRVTVGKNAPERPDLDVRITGTHTGKGYRLHNLVYQSRPGFYVSANLYLPANPSPPLPAVILQHSFHYPKTQGELHDMGELWARTGCAVLILERLGFGERIETAPWYRYSYSSRQTFKQQLGVIGETHTGWMAWDIIRSVDLLFERADIDQDRIILIGSVAGGGEPAAIAAALDPRIDALVPYNYDHGRIRLDADFPGELTKQLTMSFVTASIAPRRYVRAFEFGWEGAEQSDFPGLWVDAWQRSRKVWKLYDREDNLATIQAYGLIRLSMERVSHCFSVGPQQRHELYPILRRWFNIPLPSAEDLAILPDSRLSVNPYREEARRQEKQRRRPHSDLLSIPPSVSAELPRKQLHQIAHEMGLSQIRAARKRRAALDAGERDGDLRVGLRRVLGDIDPPASPHAEIYWTREVSGAEVEALSVDVEEGIAVPLLLIRPVMKEPVAVVVAITKGGKDRFLANDSAAIAKLVQAGVAVCLPDVRSTGETSPVPDWYNDGIGEHELELALGNTLLGARLKDLRTVLAYLRSRPEIADRRIALWGDAFAPANPSNLYLDELQWESGPQVQYHSEPLGATLALLAGLYEDDIAAVAAQRGLKGYLSLLEDAFTYTPMDSIVPGIAEVGDIADVAAALAPRPLLLAGLVDGRNVRLEKNQIDNTLEPVRGRYRSAGAADRLRVESDPQDAAAWLVDKLETSSIPARTL